jgi:hypothetical protein
LSNEGSKGQTGDRPLRNMEEIDLTGEQRESGSDTSESEYIEDATVITNEVSSDEELTPDYSEVNQEEIQIVERRTTTRVRHPKKWPSDMILYKAMGTQMIEPKTIQETSSIPDRELWKLVMQEEYDLLMENETWKL